jgi:hypothetical protein
MYINEDNKLVLAQQQPQELVCLVRQKHRVTTRLAEETLFRHNASFTLATLVFSHDIVSVPFESCHCSSVATTMVQERV